MLRSKMDVQNDAQVPSTSKTTVISATGDAQAVYLELYQQSVRFQNLLGAGDDANVTVYLPNVTEAKGLTFSFVLFDQDGDADFIVADNDESLDWGGDYTLDAEDDCLTLRSDGMSWVVVENDIA